MSCYEPLQLESAADAQRPLVCADGDAKIVRVAFTPNRVDFAEFPVLLRPPGALAGLVLLILAIATSVVVGG
jgi:hypothetical protein